jgi:hypothetical protein
MPALRAISSVDAREAVLGEDVASCLEDVCATLAGGLRVVVSGSTRSKLSLTYNRCQGFRDGRARSR